MSIDRGNSASQMKEIAECGFQFRQTLSSISEEAAKKLKAEADKRANHT